MDESIDRVNPLAAAGLAFLLQPWVLVAAGVTDIAEAKLSSPLEYFAVFLFCLLCSASYIVMETYAALRPAEVKAALPRCWNGSTASRRDDRVPLARARALPDGGEHLRPGQRGVTAGGNGAGRPAGVAPRRPRRSAASEPAPAASNDRSAAVPPPRQDDFIFLPKGGSLLFRPPGERRSRHAKSSPKDRATPRSHLGRRLPAVPERPEFGCPIGIGMPLRDRETAERLRDNHATRSLRRAVAS